MRSIAVVAGLALLSGCATVPRRPVQPLLPDDSLDGTLARLDKRIATEVASRKWPDLAVGLVAGGKLTWWKGYGEVDAIRHAPVTDETYFRVGSITKTFTGLALLQLQEQGKLSLDDPLEKFIPEVKGVVYPTSEKPPIRLRHLVTHTSGLPSWFKAVDYSDLSRRIGEADLVGALSGLKLEGTPGAIKSYSNYANCLSGMVVHRVSGVPYNDWVTTHIAAPRGMALRWAPEAIPPGELASGHKRGPGNALVLVPESWRLGACDSAGGMYARLDDLAAYAAFELSAWPPHDGPESPVATRATLRESQTLHGRDFGVNWILNDDPRLGPLVWHNGSTGDYSAVLMLLPDSGIAAIALLGDDMDGLEQVARDLLSAAEPFFPEPRLALMGPVRDAFERLIPLFDPGGGPAPADLFSASFQEHLKGKDIDDLIQSVRLRGGQCRLRRVIESTPTKARVRLGCAGGGLDVFVELSSKQPRSIAGFLAYWAP